MPRNVPAAALALALAACVPSEGPSMRPFEDCLSCHDGGQAPGWTVAGTWYKGSEIVVVDSAGKSVTLRGNAVGNFYTRESLAFPLTSVRVDGASMQSPPAPASAFRYGGCNLCHHAESALAVGPLMAPGQDCLACHGPGGIADAKFSAAGTVAVGGTFPNPVPVTVDGVSTTTNSAGNFFFSAKTQPIAFPAAPTSVNGKPMGDPPGSSPSGSCNACHLGGIGSPRDPTGAN